ncbi:hypothetical protein [Cereibacter changlensis]|uniref:hypothetical protein n=1 Tax=Cereibacter changlensis TaxID=402884 RepID=UPI0040345B0E
MTAIATKPEPALGPSNGTRGAAPGLVWPSGRGHEIALIRGSLDCVRRTILAKGSATPPQIDLVEEDGAKALVLRGLVEGPVSILNDPSASRSQLAVIADDGQDSTILIDRLALLLAPLSLVRTG